MTWWKRVRLLLVTSVILSLVVTGYAVAAQRSSNTTAERSIPTQRLAEIKQTEAGPTIDGAIEAVWQSATSYTVDILVEGTASSATDLSAVFRGLYDNVNLYLLIEVTDESLTKDSTPQTWHDDAIEIYIDGNKSQGSTYDNDDRQMVFPWNDPQIYRDPRSAPLPPNLQRVMVDTADGYRLEIMLPLTEIGVASSAGTKFGLDVYVNDDDDGGNRDTKVAWNSTIDPAWQTPSAWGVGRLGLANRAPTALNDQIATHVNITRSGTSVLANDSDPDGDALTISETTVSRSL